MDSDSSTFIAATTENIEDARPKYNFRESQKAISSLIYKIVNLKHAINVFNSTYVIEGLGLTIDQVLIYMPILTSRLSKLSCMKDSLPKTRVVSFNKSPLIEYQYANYIIQDAKEEYDRLNNELVKLQVALDNVNSIIEFEIDDEVMMV